MTREERIQETVLTTVRKRKALSPATSDWLGEDWKTENWGLDSEQPVLNFRSVEETYHNETRAELKPPRSDRDPIEEPSGSGLKSRKYKLRSNVGTLKSDAEYTRRLEGVLTPLDSPALQGGSIPVHLMSLCAYGFYRRGTSGRTASDRNFGP